MDNVVGVDCGGAERGASSTYAPPLVSFRFPDRVSHAPWALDRLGQDSWLKHPVRIYQYPEGNSFWICPASVDGSANYPWMPVAWLVGQSPPSPPEERDESETTSCSHWSYQSGQYGQQPVQPWNPYNRTSVACRHPPTNWNQEPWQYLHENGLQLHTQNLIDMTEGQITAFLQMLFYDDGEDGVGVREKLEKTAGHEVWSIMKTHKSKYRGYEVRCMHCGAVAWAAWKPGSTNGRTSRGPT